MPTFLNLEIDKKINWKFFIKHVIYSLIWLTGFWLLVLRGDYSLLGDASVNYELIIRAIPLAFIAIVILVMFASKWYYNIALIFYPILVIFWFLPKMIIRKGKIYLFSNYANFVYKRIKRIKSTVIHVLILLSIILLLSIWDSSLIKILSIAFFTYMYFKITYRYIKQSFQPAQLFGANIDDYLESIIKEPEKSYVIIKSFEEAKGDEKLPELEMKRKRIERLMIASFLIENLGTSLSGLKGKKAFLIAWGYQLLGFIILTFSYYTFLNFEIFKLDQTSFKINIDPSLFDFFYYTVKTITFSNIEAIIPISIFARIVEISSFFTIGIFVLIFITSIVFSFRQDKLSENIKRATDVCLAQNKFIAEHIKLHYKTDVETVLLEAGTIKTSMENIKRIFEKIF